MDRFIGMVGGEGTGMRGESEPDAGDAQAEPEQNDDAEQ
jgi:hypothetical protein